MTSERSEKIFLLVFLALMTIYAMRPIEAFDTFWQLQSGKYIWKTGNFIYTDIFSLAYDADRIEHCWLHDVLLYISYLVGGYNLLSLFKPLTILTCMGILLLWTRRQQVENSYSFVVLLLCLLASEPSWLIRPQLWTFIFATLYISLLLRGREVGWRAWGWLIPVMLFWANVHAGCVFGFVLIGLFWVGELIRVIQKKAAWRSLVNLAICGVLTFAVAFINPYGYRIPLTQLLGHLKQHQVMTGDAPLGMLGNMEWLPPTFSQVPFFFILMILWGGLILWRIRRLDPAEGIFFLAFLYMGISQIRHTTLVAVLAGFFLPGAMEVFFSNIEARWNNFKKYVPVGRYVALSVLLVLIFIEASRGTLGLGLKPFEYPEKAADFVLEKNLPPQLYNSYDWGGYLMWRFYPKHLVFVDGRSTNAKYFHQSSVIDATDIGWQEYLDENNINTIITRTCFYDTGEPVNLVFQLAQMDDWQLVFADDVALVFTRRINTPEGVDPLDKSLAYNSMYQEASRLYSEDTVRTKAHISMALAALKLGRQQEAREIFESHIQGTELLPYFNKYIGRIQ